MATVQMPLFAALADKMRWHQARQSLLAENVANADTPGFRPSDLKAYSFEEHLRSAAMEDIGTAVTGPGHIAVAPRSAFGGFESKDYAEFEVTPSGNGVTLEDEMMKISANQMDFQAITSLYTRSLRLLRTALGRQ